MVSTFHIGGLRHQVTDTLRHKLGLKKYRIITSTTIILLLVTAILPISMSSKEEIFAENENDFSSVADIRFLYTFKNGGNFSQSNLIKTKDEKYILIDTGWHGETTRKTIKNTLKNYQKTKKLTIHYLVVSHLDADHIGNVINIINDNDIDVKNVIVKQESIKKGTYGKIIEAAKKEKATIYTNVGISGYKKAKKMTAEGTGNAKISVGKYLTLYFFNTTNVYSGRNCSAKGRIKGYNKIDSCRSNANSYAILVEVTTNAGPKYAYLPNDLENFGYSTKSEKETFYYYNAKKGKKIKTTRKVYGTEMGNVYSYTSGRSIAQKAPSETKVALEISSKLGNKISDILIYQISHHGLSNAKDAIDILGVNNKNVYAVNNRKNDNYQKLDKVKKRLVAGKGKNGVYCTIASDGKSKCDYEPIKIKTLKYKMNGGTGSIAAQGCIGNDYCSVKITKAEPSRSGYTFLGWAKKSDAKSGPIKKGSNFKITDNQTLYAIWAPNYSLTYNANGGANPPEKQTCHPKSAKKNASCSVKVSTKKMSRAGYKFIGWNQQKDAKKAGKVGKDTMALNRNKTLYAIWRKYVKINATVSGGNGSVKLSTKTNQILSREKVTVYFKPNSGYIIDTVKVNGTQKSVSNNKLILKAEETDLSVVVTYKSNGITPEPETTHTYYVYFNDTEDSSSLPDTISCTTTTENPNSCDVTLPSSVPTLEGHSFLGYTNPDDETSNIYYPNQTYTLTDDLYLNASWESVHILSYDLRGASSPIFINSQECKSATNTDETCNLIIDATRPIKEGYEFFGWTTDEESETPDHLPGETLDFDQEIENVTLYAIWAESAIEWQQGQDYITGSEIDLILEIEYPLEDFVALLIDDQIVDASNYELSEGSTILTIKNDYIETLEPGTHTLQAKYDNDTVAKTTFTITDSNAGDDEVEDDSMIEDNDDEDDDYSLAVPNTGENSNEESGGSSIFSITLPLLTIAFALGYLKLHKHHTHLKFD